jgi:hypothetical protein
VAAVEPTSTGLPPPRPVWVGPAIFAAIGIVVVVLIAVVHRHDDRDDTAARSTTTTTVHRTTTTARPVSGPLGGAGNPIHVGAGGTIGGWTITVLSPSDSDGAVQASVRIQWNGTSTQSIGAVSELSLLVDDPDGVEHELGGPACPGDPASALAAVPGLDAGTSDTLALCWSVSAADRAGSLLAVRASSVAEPLYLALA